MAISLPNGALVALDSGFGTSVAISAISNAVPAVLTVGTHTVIAGDIIVLTSGWSRLNYKAVRVLSITSTTITLDGYDTTNTTIYPPGGGAGSFIDVSGWTQVAQITASTTSGGVQQFLTYQFLEGDSQLRIPTIKDPFGIQFTIADDPTLAGYIAMAAANDDRLPRVVRVSLPNGGKLFYNAYISLNKTPSLTVNQLMEVTAELSLLAEPVRYAT